MAKIDDIRSHEKSIFKQEYVSAADKISQRTKEPVHWMNKTMKQQLRDPFREISKRHYSDRRSSGSGQITLERSRRFGFGRENFGAVNAGAPRLQSDLGTAR